MLGIPGDTVDNQEKSLAFYNKTRPNLISVYWLTYYPKTSIIDYADTQGILDQADIEKIEQGERLFSENYMSGGDYKNPEKFYCFAFIMRILPFLPKSFVDFLVRSKLYKAFRINSYFLSIALPRIIQILFDKNDLRGKEHIVRFINKSLRSPKKWIRQLKK